MKEAQEEYLFRATIFFVENACPFGLVRLAFAAAEVIVMERTP